MMNAEHDVMAAIASGDDALAGLGDEVSEEVLGAVLVNVLFRMRRSLSTPQLMVACALALEGAEEHLAACDGHPDYSVSLAAAPVGAAPLLTGRLKARLAEAMEGSDE